MDENRLIDLEIKISHQDFAIEELQKALYLQQLEIEKLEKNFKRLTERLKEATGRNEIGPANEKPPHY